jgi:YhfC intramembrane metalloprotease
LQNIDPLLMLQPALSLAMVLSALVYWWRTRGFRGVVLLLGAVAYWVAIAAKQVVDLLVVNGLARSHYGALGLPGIGLALIVGLETVVFEVGLAYAFAVYGVRKRGIGATDAVPYGISLAFWENGVLLGLLALFDLVVVYLLLGTGSSIAETTYSALVSSAPNYFLPPLSLLPTVLLGTLERVSSLLAHLAWGILSVLAALTGRKRYLAYALPMGLVDALVPFASRNFYLFEGAFFVLSLAFIAVAHGSLVAEKRRASERSRPGGPG